MNIEHTHWEVYTGKLIVSFGDIELLTYKLFESWLPCKKAQEYTLGKRLNKLIGYLDRLPDNSKKKDSIKNMLISANRLNDIRNQVSHNPVILKKFDKSKYEAQVTDLRGENDPVSLEQLNEYANEVESLKAELFIAVSQYTNRGIDELFT